MDQLTRAVLAHKKLVVLAWVVLTLIGLATASSAINALDQKLSGPGREGWDTNVEIVDKYGNGGDTLPLLAVVELPQGASTVSVIAKQDRRVIPRAGLLRLTCREGVQAELAVLLRGGAEGTESPFELVEGESVRNEAARR